MSIKPISVILLGQKVHSSGCLEYGDFYKKIMGKSKLSVLGNRSLFRLFTREGDIEYTGCGNTENRGLKAKVLP